jgi:hypothetical protein
VAIIFLISREPPPLRAVYFLNNRGSNTFFATGTIMPSTSKISNYCFARECEGNSIDTANSPSNSLRW